MIGVLLKNGVKGSEQWAMGNRQQAIGNGQKAIYKRQNAKGKMQKEKGNKQRVRGHSRCKGIFDCLLPVAYCQLAIETYFRVYDCFLEG
jgi:hypothetical protein